MSEHLKRSINQLESVFNWLANHLKLLLLVRFQLLKIMVENKENVLLKAQVEQSSGIAVFWSDRLHI